jgi:hypothetical protein
LPTDRAGPLLTRLITTHSTRSLGACGRLLASAAAAGSYLTETAADALLSALSTDQPESLGWNQVPIDAAAVADTITGLLAANPTHAASPHFSHSDLRRRSTLRFRCRSNLTT